MTKSLKLYHYTSVEAAANILRTGELWLSDVDTLPDRDGEEIRTRFKIFKEQIIQSKGFNDLTASNREKFVDWFVNNLLRLDSPDKREFFIACFCLSNQNKHLWDNYAHKQSGNALEFEFPMPLGYESRFPLQGFFMSYKDPGYCEKLHEKLDGLTYPDFDAWIPIVKELGAEQGIKFLHEQKGYIQCRDTLCDAFIRYCLSTKEQRFQDEQEFRLVACSGLFKTWFDNNKISVHNGKRMMRFAIPQGFFTGTVYEVGQSDLGN